MIKAIQARGGSVFYDYEMQSGAHSLIPKWARKIFGDDFSSSVTHVGFNGMRGSVTVEVEGKVNAQPPITPLTVDLSPLRELRKLDHLKFSNVQLGKSESDQIV